MRVLKWTVSVDGQPHDIGTGPVVLVGCQHYPDYVQVWTEEPDHDEPARRPAQVFATGQTIPALAMHLGSTIASRDLVWHLYALLPTTKEKP